MNYLLRLLNVRRGEVERLLLASAVFFLAQVDDGIVKSVASAVFNVRAGVDKLPLMYTWIAVVFSLSMGLLSWLTSKVARQRMLMGLMLFVAALLAANALLLLYDDRTPANLGEDAYSFLFVSSELARTLMNFQIWIVAGGICYTSRAKVLFPLLASSAVLGDIAGGFVVRFLSAMLASHMLYALAVANIVVVLVLLRMLLRRYFIVQEGDADEVGASLKENLHYFARSSYLLLLFVLSIAVFALYTAIHYAFNVIGRQYFASEAEMTEFFGLFFGLTGVATLFVTTFLLQRLLRWMGTGNVYFWVGVLYVGIAGVLLCAVEGIAPLPIIAAIFAGNLLNYLLLDSVIAPAYQVLIKLVPPRNSDGTRMVMEGGFMLLGGLAGAGITSLHARHILTLGELFAALIVLSVGMVICGVLLRRSYTAVLVQAVREQNFDPQDDQAMQATRRLIAHSADFSRSLLLHREDGVRQLGIEMLRDNPGPAGEQVCVELLGHDNPRLRSAALAALRPRRGSVSGIFPSVLRCLDDDDDEVRLAAARCVAALLDDVVDAQQRTAASAALALRLRSGQERAAMQSECLMGLERLGHEESAAERGHILAALLDSAEPEELIAGIEAAGSARDEHIYSQLQHLIESEHPSVREAAVHGLGKMGDEDAYTPLRSMLADPDPDVVAAAIQVLKNIETEDVRRRLLVDLGTASLREWEGISAVLMAMEDDALDDALLASCRHRLIEANRYLVAVDAIRQIDDAATELLVDQLRAEANVVLNGTVRTLGHLADMSVVGDLIERLGGDDEAARDNAIELLENVAESELLSRLLPLLSGGDDQQVLAAREIAGWEEIDLERVLSYLLETGGAWTQVAAVWCAAQWGYRSLCERADVELAEPARHIMDEMGQHRGDSTMSEQVQPLTTMEKITFLRGSSFFAALPLEELYQVALSIQEESVRAGEKIINEGTMGDKMYIVVRGQLEVKKEGGPRLAVLGEKQVFGDMALLDDEPRSASVQAIGDVHLLSLQRANLERILRRYSSIAFNMMRILSRRLRETQAG